MVYGWIRGGFGRLGSCGRGWRGRVGVGGGFVWAWSLAFVVLLVGLLRLLGRGLMVRAVSVRGLYFWVWVASVVVTALP